MNALERVGMAGFGSKSAEALSFGQRKLVMMASLLAMEPRIFLLDEPAAGLSPERQDAMAGILQAIQDEGNVVFFVEHNHDFVRSLAQRVLVMERGKIKRDGPPEEIFGDGNDVVESYLG